MQEKKKIFDEFSSKSRHSTAIAFRVPVKKSAKNTLLGFLFPQRARAEKRHTQKERDEKSV